MNMTKLLIFLLLVSSFEIFAQNITVKGNVSDVKNVPIFGVNITVKETSTGAVTDFDGDFIIETEIGETLVFSYVGFISEEVIVSTTMVNIILEEETESLEQVVVVGYGSSSKKDLTTSIETLNSENFNEGPIASFEQLLAGRTAGVQITPANGQPGTGGVIKIRGGTSSLSANTSPLIVVDGVPLDQTNRGALNYINPNDIESLTILKDASAAAIYGSRATAGVIIVKTKSGKNNTPLQLNYNSFTSIGDVSNTVNVLDSRQFNYVVRDNATANEVFLLGNDSNNWQDEIYRASVSYNHNISASKGFDNSSIRLSLGYFNEEGILKRTAFERVSGGLKYVQRLFNGNLKIETNVRGSYVDEEFGNQGALNAAVLFDPTQSLFSGNLNFGGYTEWIDQLGNPNNFAPRNPIGLIQLTKNQGVTKRSTGNIKLDYKNLFLEGLKATINLGYDYSEFDGNSIVDQRSASTTRGGTISESESLNRNQLFDGYLNYVKNISAINSTINMTAGYSFQKFFRSSENSTVDGLGETFNPQPFATQNSLLSYFGRLNYSYNNKYLLTINYRNDASSRLNPRDRRRNFGGFSLGWNISNENFLSKRNVVSNLKIRGGYAETGQQEINQDFGFLPRFTVGDDRVRYQFGNEFVTTIRPQGFDPNIRWEVSKTINLGIDYGFFNDRITGSIDWYQREVEDVLNFTSVPAGSNLTDALVTNIGNLENSGLEFVFNLIPIRTKAFSWNLGFNISFFENEITKLSLNDTSDSIGSLTGSIAGGRGNTIQINSVGYEQNSFYVLQQVYDDSGKPIEGLYVDTDGDGIITDDDRYRYKSPNPDYVMGLNSLFKYKDIDLSFTWRASVGNYVYNNIASNRGNLQALSDANVLSNLSTSYLETGFEEPQLFSDYYVQDASFLKLDNVTLGYNIKELFKRNVTLRTYTTIQNVFVFTDYDGIDPELNNGIDGTFFPRSRTFLLGLDFNF